MCYLSVLTLKCNGRRPTWRWWWRWQGIRTLIDFLYIETFSKKTQLCKYPNHSDQSIEFSEMSDDVHRSQWSTITIVFVSAHWEKSFKRMQIIGTKQIKYEAGKLKAW